MIALFDLDGTLTDPKVGITRSVQYALERLGRPVPEADALTWMIGPPLIAGFTELLGGTHDVQEAVRLYRERYSDVGLFENEVYAGIPAVLRQLRDQDLRLYVATSKLNVFARRILENLNLAVYFDGIHGSVPGGTLDHKPELLAHILSEYGIAASHSLMIGDRRHDIVGAHAVTMRGLGVLWGYGSPDELEAAGADQLVERPADLARTALSMLNG